MPTLWQIINKYRNCRINITTIDNKLTVSILRGKKINVYADSDIKILLLNLKKHLLA